MPECHAIPLWRFLVFGFILGLSCEFADGVTLNWVHHGQAKPFQSSQSLIQSHFDLIREFGVFGLCWCFGW